MIELFKSLRRGEESDPLRVLEALTSRLPEEARAPTLELLSLVRDADAYGPPDPPEWLLALLEGVGREVGLSSWLLSAVSWELVGYDPGPRPELGPHGVLGIPLDRVETPERYGAPLEALAADEDDPELVELHEAVARVKRGAWTGARILKVYADRSGSLAGGLERYLEEANLAGRLQEGGGRGPASVGDVAGTFVVLLARRAPGETEELELLGAGVA